MMVLIIILRVLKDLNRKANCVLCTFRFADSFIKCFFIKLFCLCDRAWPQWQGATQLISRENIYSEVIRQ